MQVSQNSFTGDFDLFENFKKDKTTTQSVNSVSSLSNNNNTNLESNNVSILDVDDTPIFNKIKNTNTTSVLSFVENNQNIVSVSPSNLKILNNIPSGSTVKLSKGIYPTDININSKNNITIIADEGAIIKGNIQINSSKQIKLEGFKVESNKNKDAFDEKRQNIGSNVPELIVNNSKNVELKSISFNSNLVN